MYKLILTLLLLSTISSATAQTRAAADSVLSQPVTVVGSTTAIATPHHRPRVALVLGGGGAKGMAHVGVLKVIERAGIPVDMICGTSIGSLVGGLYAMGYSATELDSLVRHQDWNFLLSDNLDRKQMNLESRTRGDQYVYTLPLSQLGKGAFTQQALVKGQNLANLFTHLAVGFHDSIDFNTMPIPYCAVATDMVKFQEVDMHSGYVAQAMRASMSIPGMFTPVRLDSMVLVDGGLRNNYPVDVARSMGADYVIGVNLNKIKDMTNADFNKPGAVITRIAEVHTENKFRQNWADTDIALQIDADPYNSMSFQPAAVDTLIARGERCAMSHWHELMALKARLGLALDDDTTANTARRRSAGYSHPVLETVPIAAVTFTHVLPAEEHLLRKKFHLERKQLSIDQIENVITELRGRLYYNDASYQLLGDHSNGYRLHFDTEGKKASQVYLGARFDSEELAAIQIESFFPNIAGLKKHPYTLEAKLRLGKRIKAGLTSTLSTSSTCNLALGYNFSYNDIDLYRHGKRYYDMRYYRHMAELGFKGFVVSNFMMDLYVRWSYYRYRDMLGRNGADSILIENDHYFSYHARLYYNDEDDTYFTTHGSSAEVQAGLYTTNFVHFHGTSALATVMARWRSTWRVGSHMVLQPGVYGRLIFKDTAPYVLQNYVGGPWFGHYFDQQLPFAGLGHVEYTGNSFAAVDMGARYQLTQNNFVLADFAVAEHGEKVKNTLDHTPYFGVRAGYVYRTIVGPLGAYVGWNSMSHKASFYINLGLVF